MQRNFAKMLIHEHWIPAFRVGMTVVIYGAE